MVITYWLERLFKAQLHVDAAPLVANLGALFAALLFGASAVAVRVAVQDISPSSLAVYRYGQGALLLLFVLFISSRNLLRIERKDLPLLALLGLIFFSLYPLAYNTGLRLTEVSRGSLMLATVPLWSAALAWSTKKEYLSRRQLLGVLMALLGVGLVLAEQGLSWDAATGSMIGSGLIILAAFGIAVYGILAKSALSRYNPITVTAYAMAFGTLFLLPIAVADGFVGTLAKLQGQVAMSVLYLGIFGGAAAIFLWTFALSRLTPTRVAVYLNLDPVVATLLAALLLSEVLTGVFVLGFLAVLAGVLFVNWPLKHASSAAFSSPLLERGGEESEYQPA